MFLNNHLLCKVVHLDPFRSSVQSSHLTDFKWVYQMDLNGSKWIHMDLYRWASLMSGVWVASWKR